MKMLALFVVVISVSNAPLLLKWNCFLILGKERHHILLPGVLGHRTFCSVNSVTQGSWGFGGPGGLERALSAGE